MDHGISREEIADKMEFMMNLSKYLSAVDWINKPADEKYDDEGYHQKIVDKFGEQVRKWFNTDKEEEIPFDAGYIHWMGVQEDPFHPSLGNPSGEGDFTNQTNVEEMN